MDSTVEFNSLLDLIRLNYQPIRDDGAYQFFGGIESSISVVGNAENILFNQTISKLYEIDKDIFRTISRKTFKDRVIALLRIKKVDSLKFSKEDVSDFYKSLREIEEVEFTVLRGIHGIIIIPPTPFTFGDFTIYNYKNHEKEFKKLSGILSEVIWNDPPPFLIEYKVKVREANRAEEIADQYFLRLTLFLKFMIGRKDHFYDIGILDYKTFFYDRAYIFSSKGSVSANSRNLGTFQPVDITDEYFRNSDIGHSQLLLLVSKTNPSKLERKIINSVEWIGKSINEKDLQVAFIQVAIAIEIIFTVQEKSIITPSILNQISESIALLLGDNLENRLKIEKQIKDLYSIRSAIVHAGKEDIDENDYTILLSYAGIIIRELLTKEELKNLSSIEELYRYLKDIKYS